MLFPVFNEFVSAFKIWEGLKLKYDARSLFGLKNKEEER